MKEVDVMMEEIASDVPLPAALVCNLKRSHADDGEAEFDEPETIEALCAALDSHGCKTTVLEADEGLFRRLEELRPGIVFNIAEGKGGRSREAHIPAILEYMGIPFTGSDAAALAVALDKTLTKRIAASYGVRVPRGFILGGDMPEGIRFPLILKPNAEGSSKGINDASVVSDAAELAEKFQPGLLAEEYVEGREFTVGLLGNGEKLRVFEPMEIIYKRPTQGDYHVYSYGVKRNFRQFVEYRCPAGLTPEQDAEMKNAARTVFDALSCRDLARADFRMDGQGRIYFIEINPLPGFAPGYSDYPMLAQFNGMEYGELVGAVLDAALARGEAR